MLACADNPCSTSPSSCARSVHVAVAERDIAERASLSMSGQAPRADYLLLSERLQATLHHSGEGKSRLGRLVADRAQDGDVVWCGGEDVAIAVAWHGMLKRKALRLVSIGHSLGPLKKRILHRRAMG